MVFRVRPPRQALLTPLVEHLWYCEIEGASGSEILLPTGRGQLVVGLSSDHAGAIVQGPMSRPHEINSAMQRQAVGVAFRVGGLTACVAADASDLADQMLSVDDVWGRHHRTLAEELSALATPDAVFDRLEEKLVRWAMDHTDFPAPTAADPVVRQAVTLLGGQHPVAAVADQLDLDRRALTARFRSQVGFGLKQFGRLRRFERAVSEVRAADAAPLSDIAVRLGYSDQAHLSRDFRDFSGFTPAALHRDASPSPNHVIAGRESAA